VTIVSLSKKLFAILGYKIQRVTRQKTRETIGESYALMKTLGFAPKTVIDVGAAGGTPELYENFPESFFLLIDPFEPNLKSILKQYQGLYVLAAAGSRFGMASFNVHENHLEGSSLYQETMGSEADGCRITVPMIRLDDIVMEKSLSGPYLIKIDVQGGELDVLDGAQETLAGAEVVVLEVSMFEFMKGAPQFFDVVSYLNKRGFVAYDITALVNRPRDGALAQIDVVFVRENGLFRNSHCWV